jgi:hypothetical protein
MSPVILPPSRVAGELSAARRSVRPPMPLPGRRRYLRGAGAGGRLNGWASRCSASSCSSTCSCWSTWSSSSSNRSRRADMRSSLDISARIELVSWDSPSAQAPAAQETLRERRRLAARPRPASITALRKGRAFNRLCQGFGGQDGGRAGGHAPSPRRIPDGHGARENIALPPTFSRQCVWRPLPSR